MGKLCARKGLNDLQVKVGSGPNTDVLTRSFPGFFWRNHEFVKRLPWGVACTPIAKGSCTCKPKGSMSLSGSK